MTVGRANGRVANLGSAKAGMRDVEWTNVHESQGGQAEVCPEAGRHAHMQTDGWTV